MATLSDLKEVKEALDAGLVSQVEYDDVKRDYLRAKKEAFEFQTKELRAKEEYQKMELLAKKEALEAKKEFHKKKSDAELRVFALDAIVKHGSSLMSEEQRVDLVRDYAKMSGLDGSAEKDEPASKRQRPGAEERNAVPPESSTPLRTPPAAPALPPPADAPTQPAPDRAPAPAASGTTPPRSVVIERKIFHYNEWKFMEYLKNSGIINED